MAQTISIFSSSLLFFTVVLFSSLSADTDHSNRIHLHFYFHDTVSGPHPTAVRIAQASSSSATFATLSMIDDPLTAGPEPGSRLVGRAQGMYGAASQSEAALLMVMNMAFVDGKYNGSTITVLGRNAVFDAVREMPIVGGTGAFRFARGYAQARTHTFDVKSGDAVVEYNVYVYTTTC